MPATYNQMPAGNEAHNNEPYLLLIEQSLANDEKAFRKLYDLMSDTMYGICMRYSSNTQETEDMFQESMCNLYQKLGSFSNTGNFMGWAKQLFTNGCLNYIRNHARHTLISLDNVEEIGEDTPLNTRNFNMQEVVGFIQQLPDTYRILINLFFVEGYKQSEIATMLATTEAAVKVNVHRAKNRLAAIIMAAGGRY